MPRPNLNKYFKKWENSLKKKNKKLNQWNPESLPMVNKKRQSLVDVLDSRAALFIDFISLNTKLMYKSVNINADNKQAFKHLSMFTSNKHAT